MICITWWKPTESGFYQDYHYYCDAQEIDEAIKELNRLGYKYEIEIIED